MAIGVNKVLLLGHVGGDPEVRRTQSGAGIVNFSLATSDSWKDKETGEKKEQTEWHRVVTFGKLAEVCEKYVRKGSLLYIEGHLQTRKWQDQSGQDRYMTEVVVGAQGTLRLLGGKSEEQTKPNSTITHPPSSPQTPGQRKRAHEVTQDFDDDIPF